MPVPVISSPAGGQGNPSAQIRTAVSKLMSDADAVHTGASQHLNYVLAWVDRATWTAMPYLQASFGLTPDLGSIVLSDGSYPTYTVQVAGTSDPAYDMTYSNWTVDMPLIIQMARTRNFPQSQVYVLVGSPDYFRRYYAGFNLPASFPTLPANTPIIIVTTDPGHYVVLAGRNGNMLYLLGV
jgi:hypothetical protein